MQVIKPARLKKGDTIGLISPASSPDDLSKVEESTKYFEKLGYKVKIGKNVGNYRGYLAGTDEERLEDLHSMFSDKTVKAIMCLRGGYGAFRLLDKINYKMIQKNPKIFVGYSEITALQNAIFSKTGLITFAGPMPAVDFVNNISPFTEEWFWKVVTSNKKIGKVKYPENSKLPFINKGTTNARILGGNLAVFSTMLGTEFFPDMKDKILLLEDIDEKPYKIDRMLNQLRLAKVFKGLKGVILGKFVECYEQDPNKKTLSLGEVIEDYFKVLKIPTIYSFPHGHIKDFITIPIGLKIGLNATKGTVEFLESAVS
ncbi:MAG: S66 peptidase family protein [Ignavibacterium sp.]|uniref:S66 peptidase family protein n=1 Tax=Ignavibacterium sp. TaxID=2651167 RepID=UPI00404AED31